MGTQPEGQWLRLHVSTLEAVGSIPGWGTKTLHPVQCGKKKKSINNDDILSLIVLIIWHAWFAVSLG